MTDLPMTEEQAAALTELNQQLFAAMSEQVLPQLFKHFPEDMVAAHLMRAGADVMAQIYVEDHRNEITTDEFKAKTMAYVKQVVDESLNDALLDAAPTAGVLPS